MAYFVGAIEISNCNIVIKSKFKSLCRDWRIRHHLWKLQWMSQYLLSVGKFSITEYDTMLMVDTEGKLLDYLLKKNGVTISCIKA